MRKSDPKISRSAQASGFVLTRELGEKISAVEGMRLSSRMSAALARGRSLGLSGDERRSLVKEHIRKK